jgi:imipenem/basic amino acid-specific outer membrane pore
MKLVKMSLAAALLVSGAYALDNVKVNGSAKLIYQTTDTDNVPSSGLFTRSGNIGGSSASNTPTTGATSANGGAQVLLGATADLVDNISAGAEVQVFTTMGLENVLVDTVMATGSAEDQWNMSQLWMAASLGKTTVKVGRMELDTPLAFTEKWNVAKNTFEAAVVINGDIENTTLVGAYVGKDNGNMNAAVAGDMGAFSQGQTAYMGANNTGGTFNSFYGGAYAVGVVNSSLENTTLQGWYYNVNDLAEAIWLQADVKNVADMVNIGVQYATVDSSNADGQVFAAAAAVRSNNDLDAWAVKVSGTVSDINLFAAYSSVDDATGQVLVVANTATQDKTKLYTGTGSIYMDGAVVGAADSTSWKIGASTKLADYAVAANYTSVDNGGNNVVNGGYDVSGYDLSVATKVAGINLKAIYTAVDADNTTTANRGALTSGYVVGNDFQTVRIIASVKF